MHPLTDKWWDKSAPWWQKWQHACSRISDVDEAEQRYLARSPWDLNRRPTERTGVSRISFRLLEQPPASIGLMAGEALHALSSALDAVAFAMASRNYDGDLDASPLVRDSSFPVCISREELDSWVRIRRRQELFRTEDLQLFWSAQSSYWQEEAIREKWLDKEQVGRRVDPLVRLRALHNIDKHRRLHVIPLGPHVPYWSSSGSDSRREVSISGVWLDGCDVAEIYDDPDAPVDGEMHWDLRLHLVEPPRRVLLVKELNHLALQVHRSLEVVVRGMVARAES